MTLTVSWSQLRVFEECRQKAKLLRAGKRKGAADARMFFPGTVVDRVTRDWLADPDRSLGGMPAMVDEIMEREERLLREDENRVVVWRDPQDKAAVRADCVQAVTQIEPALVKYVLPYDFEVDFRFRAPVVIPYRDTRVEVMLIGAMDVRVHNADPGNEWWSVFDVKMTRDDQYWKKTQGQLTFYDLANELLTGKSLRAAALFQPMCKKQVRVVPIDPDGRTQMLSHIATFATAVIDEDFPMTAPRKACVYCDFNHACPRFTPVTTRKGQKTIAY